MGSPSSLSTASTLGLACLGVALAACNSGVELIHDRDGGSPDGGGVDGGLADAGPGDGGAFLAYPGVWQVSGQDGRGHYTGQVELIADGGSYAFTRVILYANLTVEGTHPLWWVWQGQASEGTAHQLSITSVLQHGDFILSRGTLTRTTPEGPETVTGAFHPVGATPVGTFTSPSVSASETWSNRQPSGTPIFAGVNRVFRPAAPPLGPNTLSVLNSSFASFQALPAVAPYANDPDFKAANYGYWIDQTDFDFYQANPNALRVVNKITDAIALQETLSRANAYKYTFLGKEQAIEAVMQPMFVDPVAGMVVLGNQNGTLTPSGDSALWTGCYVASQAMRYQITGDATARANLLKSVNALLTLQDITGDPTTFARTLRPTTGAATLPWHQGTGAFAGLDWLQTGNNDMLKGLLYGYTSTWVTFCNPPSAADTALCQHILTNTQTLATQVPVATSTTSENHLITMWMWAVMSGDKCSITNLNGPACQAESIWTLFSGWVSGGSGSNLLNYQNLPFLVDWSGTHLNFVSYHVMKMLSDVMNLGSGASPGAIQAGVAATWGMMGAQRLGMWDLAEAAFGPTPIDPAALADARLRMRELPFPKTQANVDLRVDPAFVMGPFPALPWKNDWTTQDRTTALRGAPLFEWAFDEYAWKDPSFQYTIQANMDLPGTDYLLAYWFARKYGLLTATE